MGALSSSGGAEQDQDIPARELQGLGRVLPHGSHGLIGVDLGDTAPAASRVVAQDRHCLTVVRFQSLGQRILGIIGPLHQGLAGSIIRHVVLGRLRLAVVGLRRVELDVVGAA